MQSGSHFGNYLPSLGRDHQICSGVEFLALLVPHIALRFECRIQSFGARLRGRARWPSTTIRRQLGWTRMRGKSASPPEVVEVEEDESAFVRLRRASCRRLIARTWLEDPSVCDGCGQPMKVISAISSPEQDDVIEKILRARQEWPPVSRCAPLRSRATRPFGLALRASLRDQPSGSTSLRLVPEPSGRGRSLIARVHPPGQASAPTASRYPAPPAVRARSSLALTPALRAFAARRLASHPPWKRERRARGPPRQLEMFRTELDEECSQLAPETEEDFNQDALGDLEPL